MYNYSFEKLKSVPLYVKAKLKIINLIKNGAFPDNKLPSEKDLSEKLGISRATMREALMALSREGIISKKQGLGTLYHLSSLNSIMRIDKINDFVGLLKDGGYDVTVKKVSRDWTDDLTGMEPQEIFKNEEKYLKSEIVHYADNKVAIYSTVIIPGSVLAGSSFSMNADLKRSSTDSLSNFLNTYSREEVSHSISKFKPINIDEGNAKIFGLNRGEAVIGWNEVYYSIMDNVLCLTKIIFHPELIDFSILRKWD